MRFLILAAFLFVIASTADWQKVKGRLTKRQIYDRQQWLLNTDPTLCRRTGADIASSVEDAADRIGRVYLIFETIYNVLEKNKKFFLDLADCEGQVIISQSEKATKCMNLIEEQNLGVDSTAHALHVQFRGIGEIGHRFAICHSLDQERFPRMAIEILFEPSDKTRVELLTAKFNDALVNLKLDQRS